jgi:diaminopimelate epimerase
MRFTKAHGLGNDFILVAQADAPADTHEWARRLCDRHRGIGGDGVVLHAPEPGGVRFSLINADGLPGEISGNGLRCLAALAFRDGRAPARHVVRTVVGDKAVEVSPAGGSRYRIATDLGQPRLASRDVPIALDPPREPVIDVPVEAAGRSLLVTATSMGNPHCAVFCDAVPDDGLLNAIGPALERHPLFPQRTNVEFVTVVSRDEIRVRFWERGVGYTQASGTGSASAVVASIVSGRTSRRVRAVCDGGTLEIAWPEGASLTQTGEAELLFDGDWSAGGRGDGTTDRRALS